MTSACGCEPSVPMADEATLAQLARLRQAPDDRSLVIGLQRDLHTLKGGARMAEIREIALIDGSRLTLGARSRADVRFTDTERRVVLHEGEAFFTVQPDPLRPFFVEAEATEVRVVGTRFNLYRQPEATTVTVIEGIVDVTPHRVASPPAGADHGEEMAPHSGSAPKARLTAGQQLDIAAATPVAPQLAVAPQAARVDQATAWTTRRVIFENQRLDEVLRQFNRYNPRPLTVTDPELAARQISGVFKVHDVDLLLAFLKRQHDIRVIPSDTELQIERAR